MNDKNGHRLRENIQENKNSTTDHDRLMHDSVMFANFINAKLESLTMEDAQTFLENFEKHLTIKKDNKNTVMQKSENYSDNPQMSQQWYPSNSSKNHENPAKNKSIEYLNSDIKLYDSIPYDTNIDGMSLQSREIPNYNFASPKSNHNAIILNTFTDKISSSHSTSAANERFPIKKNTDEASETTLFTQNLNENKFYETDQTSIPISNFKCSQETLNMAETNSNEILTNNESDLKHKHYAHKSFDVQKMYEKPKKLPHTQILQANTKASNSVLLDAIQTQVSNVTTQKNEWLQKDTEHNQHQQQYDLNSKKSINILVLGQTGVGKSTWINAFANYLTYSTLGEAIAAEAPVCVIPTKFSMFDDNYQAHEILLGNHNNEIFSDQGQSATQNAKTYFFEKDDHDIYIIDTPGMDDTRGIEQDNINIQKILRAIAPFKELHAICFLFKANEARLTQSFKYSISKLLSNLSRSALNNTCFVFTNARGTFYKPGDTMGPLKAYFKEIHDREGFTVNINDANTFCLDNEAFRFICAYFSKINFGKPEIKTYADSWKHSSNEIIRLLNHASRLRPHDTSETLSINEARTWILQLVNPIINVSSVIQTNLQQFDEQMNDLEKTKHNIEELQKRANMPVASLEIKRLQKPQTVCGSQKCLHYEKICGKWQKIYKTVCHKDCSVGFGDPSQFPDPALQNCDVFREFHGADFVYTGICRICNCGIKEHKRIFYEYQVVTKYSPQTYQNVITSQRDAARFKAKLLNDCRQKINDYKQELNYVLLAMASFSIFLTQNGISQQMDIFEKHMESLIESEEKMLRLVRQCDDKNYKQLASLLLQYRHIRDNLMRNSSNISLKDVQDMRQKLFSLPLNGSKITEIYDIHVEVDKQDYAENITRCDKKSIIRQCVDWTKNKLSSFFG